MSFGFYGGRRLSFFFISNISTSFFTPSVSSLRLSRVFKSVLSYLESISNNALKRLSRDSDISFIPASLSRFLCLLVLIRGCLVCLFGFRFSGFLLFLYAEDIRTAS